MAEMRPNRPMEMLIESVDHRLELLNTKFDNMIGSLQDRFDTVVKKPDCSDCQTRWTERLKEKVDKRSFVTVGGTVIFIVSVLTVVNLWMSISASLAKAAGGP